MSATVHIIHPYTYRLKGDTLQLGPVEEWAERDLKVTRFVEEGLEIGAQVFCHLRQPLNSLSGAMEKMAFLGSSLGDIFSDERLISLVTDSYGKPIPDARPDVIPEGVWEEIRNVYTGHSELRDKLRLTDVTFCIGGALENCVASFALYHHEHYRQGKPLFYIPELCASFDAGQWRKSEKLLQERDVNPLSMEEALKELRKV